MELCHQREKRRGRQQTRKKQICNDLAILLLKFFKRSSRIGELSGSRSISSIERLRRYFRVIYIVLPFDDLEIISVNFRSNSHVESIV